VLVIDSDYYPSRARADIALIRSVTDKPIRYLVNTHWHGDHTHGNGVYRELVPDLTIVGAAPNRHFIDLNLTRYQRVAAMSKPATLARLEKTLASGTDSSGKPLTQDQRQLLQRVIVEKKTEIAELASVKVAPPTMLFDRELTLDLGNRAVVLRNWDRANSPADVTIYLPAERILFTGDMLVAPVPYVFGAWPVPWIDVLRQIEAIPVTALVPGHGPVMRDHRYTKQVRELLETARSRVEALVREGKSAADMPKLVDLSDWRGRFVTEGDVTAAEYWQASIIEGMLERMYQCVVGYRC
jgi:glyoxylase-like metal-dependent hydrolase (beta-lactamase superfamily II)